MDVSMNGLPADTPLDMSPGAPSIPCSPVEEERPSSSLSTASRSSSRIPVLSRSASMRIKMPPGAPSDRGPPRGLVRSASFVTSRGMTGFTSPSSTRHSPSTTPLSIHHSTFHHPSAYHSSTPSSTRQSPTTPHGRSFGHYTPETPRRYSQGARRSSAGERKSHSYAGVGASPAWTLHHNHHNYHNYHNHHSYHRRPTHLPLNNGPTSLPMMMSQPDTPSRSPDCDADDADSVKSFGSVASAMSCDAALSRVTYNHNHNHNHKHGAKGRNLKYALHCPHNHDTDPETYLTPTQRAARRIRELKSQLAEARREVHIRDAEISRLTRELVELRLLKATTQDDVPIASPQESRRERQKCLSVVHPAATPTPKTSATPSEGSEPELSRLMDTLAITESGVVASAGSPAGGSLAETTADSVDLTRSLADSGHYDDLTSPALSAKDLFDQSQNPSARRPRPRTLADEEEEEEEEVEDPWTEEEEARMEEEARIREESEARIRSEVEMRLREDFGRREDQLKRNHMDEYHELKEKHNDRVESLLAKLSDANLKYFEMRPMYDRSQERVRELEREVTKLKDEVTEAELRHQKMYLQMFLKGQQAARMQADDEQDGEEGSQSSVSSGGPMVDLMKQLSRTEDELEKMKALYRREVACRPGNTTVTRNGELDPEVTLQFLKSAIYYFLTDKDNSKGHLRAIESILGYSDMEKHNIGKVTK